MKKNSKLHEAFKFRKKNNLNVVDMFSGCGGLSLGFQMAGYNIKGMIDFDEDSLETAEANNLAEHYLNLDLFKENWLEKFGELKKFFRINGNTTVREDSHPSLWFWCNNQRQNYKHHISLNFKS